MLGKPLLNVGARVCSAVLAEASEDPGIVWPATVSPVRGHDEQNISAGSSRAASRMAEILVLNESVMTRPLPVRCGKSRRGHPLADSVGREAVE